MAAERPFIYDPSQQVAKNIEGVNRSVQNAWQPLIENKIRDYESISKDLANIDEIKRNLKGYHADILTSRLGTLQGDLAKTIEKNGTINVAARAKVKADIEQVKNLYIKSQQAGLVVEDVLSRMKDNAAYINDVAGMRESLIREVKDPKVMLSGQDLSDRLNEIYSKGLNVPAIGNARAYNQYKHVQKVKKNWTNPETGDLETIEYTPVDGFVFNEKTGQLDADMARIKELSKDFLTTGEMYSVKQTIGAGQALNANVEDSVINLYKQAYLGVAGFSRTIDKTSDEIKTRAANRKLAENASSDENLKILNEAKKLNNEKKKQSIDFAVQYLNLSKSRFGLAAKALGISESNLSFKLQDAGYTVVGDKFIYDKTKDNRGADDSDLELLFKKVAEGVVENQTATKSGSGKGSTKPTTPPKASSGMIQSKSGKQMSSVEFYKLTPIQRVSFKNN
jgi:phage antirepressor YoqD-like protein